MQKFNRSAQRAMELQLEVELQHYWHDVCADEFAEMMYREWQSEPDLPEDELSGSLLMEEGFVVLLHHGEDSLEAANYLTDEEWVAYLKAPSRPAEPELRFDATAHG